MKIKSLTCTEKIMLASPALFLVMPVISWWLQSDALHREMRATGGPEAIDCGLITDAHDSDEARACAVGAFKAGKPFYVRHDWTHDEFYSSIAIVRDGHRRIHVINYMYFVIFGFRVGDTFRMNKSKVVVRRRNGRDMLRIEPKR